MTGAPDEAGRDGDDGDRSVGGTPIYDRLRDLFDTARGPGGTPGAGVESSSDAGVPSAKVVVAGGPGAGKSTFVGSVSDPDAGAAEPSADTGRLTVHPNLVLCLVAAAQPTPSGFREAIGAVVLLDTRRIEDSFATISCLESESDIPFVVAVNTFGGVLSHDIEEVRDALALHADVPLLVCDAREPTSAAAVLRELVTHIMKAGREWR